MPPTNQVEASGKKASLEDPRKLFNASLEGRARRAIDFLEIEAIDAKAFKALIKAAAKNRESKSATSRPNFGTGTASVTQNPVTFFIPPVDFRPRRSAIA